MPASSKSSSDQADQIDTFQLFKQRLLKSLLMIGAAAILVIWIFESREQHLMLINQVAYPLLVVAFITYLIILQIRPATLPIIEVLSFATLAVYMLIYVYAIIYHLVPNITIYDMAIFTQWFPLVYTSAFMFLRTRQARIASILIYLALLLPTLQQLIYSDAPIMSSDIFALLLNMNIAHPVYIAVLVGIAQLKENFVQARDDVANLSVAANVDYLTGVANRRAIVKTLQYAIEQAHATNRGLGVMLIDIDYFKNINDTFGHDSGDLILIRFAESIRNILPSNMPFGRWGGEEFLIIALNVTRDQALQLAEQLRSQLETIDYPEIGRVTASLGVAILTANDTLETLVKRADQRLYRAKENGRNRVEIEG
ncbi:MAG: diguanylate cyclase [Roseiflexaceae bacterium]|nr:diguanylate cyclase [Roseiflexaceae bacterium]